MIARIADDEDLKPPEAKKKHICDSVEAVLTELRQSGVSYNGLFELLRLVILVNKNDLRQFVIKGIEEWPKEPRENEIHERSLLKYLGKIEKPG